MLPGMWLGDPRCSGCPTPMPYRRRHLARHGLACRRCLRARHHAVLPARVQLSEVRRHRHRDHGPVRPRHRHRNGRHGGPRPLRVADQSWRARRRGGHRCARSQGQGPGGRPNLGRHRRHDHRSAVRALRSRLWHRLRPGGHRRRDAPRRPGADSLPMVGRVAHPELAALGHRPSLLGDRPAAGAAPTAGRPTSSRWRLLAPCSAAE